MHQLDLTPEQLPAALLEWLQASQQTALLVAVELNPDGSLSLQAIPDIDPQLVPRVRTLMAKYEETLRRLL